MVISPNVFTLIVRNVEKVVAELLNDVVDDEIAQVIFDLALEFLDLLLLILVGVVPVFVVFLPLDFEVGVVAGVVNEFSFFDVVD